MFRRCLPRPERCQHRLPHRWRLLMSTIEYPLAPVVRRVKRAVDMSHRLVDHCRTAWWRQRIIASQTRQMWAGAMSAEISAENSGPDPAQTSIRRRSKPPSSSKASKSARQQRSMRPAIRSSSAAPHGHRAPHRQAERGDWHLGQPRLRQRPVERAARLSCTIAPQRAACHSRRLTIARSLLWLRSPKHQWSIAGTA